MRSGIQDGRRPPRERGAALLTAMVAVAVLTAFAVDLAYSSRVSLQIAANARDELRAQWLARSGVATGRLVLSFQQKLAGLPLAQGAGIPRVQLWNVIPVGPALTDGLFGGGAGPGPGGSAVPASLFAEGRQGGGTTWDARIEDEGRKVNVNFGGSTRGGSALTRMNLQALYQFVCDGRWDPLFDREDANGVRTSREDLLVQLRDWVDENEVTSAVRGGGTSATCSYVVGQPPFEDAFGDENQPYDRGEERYRAKNAAMDSLDELYLVAGVSDAFMAAFGDGLTVYLRDGEKRNVNDLDRRSLLVNAALIANPPGNPVLLQEEFAERLTKLVMERTLGGVLAMAPKEFGLLVEAAGVPINASLFADNNPNNPFTDTSSVFRVRASGKVGAVQSSIDAVVRFDPQRQAGTPGATQGRIVHWRED